MLRHLWNILHSQLWLSWDPPSLSAQKHLYTINPQHMSILQDQYQLLQTTSDKRIIHIPLLPKCRLNSRDTKITRTCYDKLSSFIIRRKCLCQMFNDQSYNLWKKCLFQLSAFFHYYFISLMCCRCSNSDKLTAWISSTNLFSYEKK